MRRAASLSLSDRELHRASICGRGRPQASSQVFCCRSQALGALWQQLLKHGGAAMDWGSPECWLAWLQVSPIAAC